MTILMSPDATGVCVDVSIRWVTLVTLAGLSLISLTMNACCFDSQNPVAWSRAPTRCDMSLNSVKTSGMCAQAGVKQTSTTEQLKREDHACKLKTRSKNQMRCSPASQGQQHCLSQRLGLKELLMFLHSTEHGRAFELTRIYWTLNQF